MQKMNPAIYFREWKSKRRRMVSSMNSYEVSGETEQSISHTHKHHASYRETHELFLEKESIQLDALSFVERCLLIETKKDNETVKYVLYFHLENSPYEYEYTAILSYSVTTFKKVALDIRVKQNGFSVSNKNPLTSVEKENCRDILQLFLVLLADKPPLRLPMLTGMYEYERGKVDRFLAE